jgi:hypothetical protein
MPGSTSNRARNSTAQIFFGEPLKADVEAGKVPMARLDDMVVRYLTGLIETGCYDASAPDSQAQPIPTRVMPMSRSARPRPASCC